MIMDLDTRKLPVKNGDMFIGNGKNLTVISKDDLLKPLQDQIKKLEEKISINEKVLEERFKKFAEETIKELISR